MKQLRNLVALVVLLASVPAAMTEDHGFEVEGDAYGAAHFPSYYYDGNIWGRCYDDYGAAGVFSGRLHADGSASGVSRTAYGTAYVYGWFDDYGFEVEGEFYFVDHYTYTVYHCETEVEGYFYYDYYRDRYTWYGEWEVECCEYGYDCDDDEVEAPV